MKLKAGKLPLDLLSRLLGKIDQSDPRVVLGPKAGEDAALIDFGDRYLVAKDRPHHLRHRPDRLVRRPESTPTTSL